MVGVVAPLVPVGMPVGVAVASGVMVALLVPVGTPVGVSVGGCAVAAAAHESNATSTIAPRTTSMMPCAGRAPIACALRRDRPQPCAPRDVKLFTPRCSGTV
jgi:hypothetical protein